jgi:hypothetical protein
MVRDVHFLRRQMIRPGAILAALASLLIGLSLAPGQGAPDLRGAAAQIAVPSSGDATAAAPDRRSAGRDHVAALDADPADLPRAASAAAPSGAWRIALPPAAAPRGVAGPRLPPARGPPAPVA